MSQQHIIKRQIIELEVEDAQDAYPLQAEVSRVYRQRIIPIIDRACTAVSDPDRVHRIERLEVDIGVIDPRNLEGDFVAKFSSVLHQALTAQIAQQDRQVEQQGRDPKAMSHLELFAFFARSGTLPWWADASQPQLLDDSLRSLIKTGPTALRGLLRELAQEPASLRRIVNHYDDERLSDLTGLLEPGLRSTRGQDPADLITILQKSVTALGVPPAHLRQQAWMIMLYVAGMQAEQSDHPASFYRAVLRRVAAKLEISYRELLADIDQTLNAGQVNIRRELRQTLASLYREAGGEAANGARVQPPVGTDEMSPPLLPRKPLTAAPADLTPGGGKAVDLAFSDADELYIGNAGLVILWPFLGHFFARLDLLDEKQFKDSAARQRAVGLLQHIATEAAPYPEYLLPLNKVLCGMELTEVFEFGPPLSATEIGECADFIQAVIAQAPILRTMSASGFRGSFLLRAGVLSSRDGAWLLRVERASYDVVLDRFPWSWTWVKLPWMAAPLRVEWS